MVNFIRNNSIFCTARDVKTAFYMWGLINDLNLTIEINGVNHGNDWQARCAIEKLFGQSYKIDNSRVKTQ